MAKRQAVVGVVPQNARRRITPGKIQQVLMRGVHANCAVSAGNVGFGHVGARS